MADERGRGLPPPRDPRDDNYLPPLHVEDDDRSRGYQPRMAPVTLPPIQDHPAGPPLGAYGQPPPHHARYPVTPMDPRDHRDQRDPRSSNYSPSPTNGYPVPPGPHPSQGPPAYLPPVGDPRAAHYPPPGPDPYGRPPPPGAYPPPGYDYNRHPHPPPPGYGPDPRAQYPPDYGRGHMPNQAPMQAGAPRQRTSIACKYCRRRKIRCSGFQSGGKCSNCIKMNQECVFQPVSSSASTAFVPISAVQGPLAPGTQIFGAYGQPLAPVAHQGPPGHMMSQSGEYPHAIQSPTTPYAPGAYDGDRRRPREEEPMPPRLPPPHPYQDQDPRRRSPATSSTNSPGTYSSYPPPGGGYDAGGSTPSQRASPGGAISGQSGGNGGVMSLGNIIDGPSRSESNNIDRNMLSRLNRPPPR